MRYREATPEDTAAIATLHAESWLSAAHRSALTDEFAAGPIFKDRGALWKQRMSAPPHNQFVIVAEEGQALIGFACAYGAADSRLDL